MLSLLIVLLMSISLVTAASAHSIEQAGCIEASTASGEHYDGDADHVPADADEGQPHHHGACHGHHVAAPSDQAEPDAHGGVASLPSSSSSAWMTATAGDPALRPPQA